MKQMVFFLLFSGSSAILRSQHFNEFASIDRKARDIPAAQTFSTASIAGYVQTNFKTEGEKLRVIYSWVITNIRYDTDSMYHINWSMDPDEKISATLRRRRGVCENYAALFTDIAIKSGFQSFVVNGYVRKPGSANNAGHSWSAVKLHDEWFLCDPTWDVGSPGNTKYFLVSPGQFIESHLPFDPLWQLLEYPLTDYAIRQGNHLKKERHAFNFADSVKAFLQLDSLQQLEASARRIKQSGVTNEKIKNWIGYNQMKIAIIYEEKDMNLYNSAVADLNKANHIFNDFVRYRNNRFMPARPDAEVNALLEPIAGILSSASKKLDQVGQSIENFQYDTGTIRHSLAILNGRVQEQKIFVKRYLATIVTERIALFYK